MNAEFETQSVRMLGKRLGRLPRPVANAVKKANRASANKLRTIIRAVAPRTSDRSREGPRHDTKVGGIRLSVKSHASANYAYVSGGGTKDSPHFLVHEYGGGVFWTKTKSSKSARSMFGNISSKQIAAHLGARGVQGHYIPSGPERTMAVSSLGAGKHGAESHFFFVTVEERIAAMQHDAAEAAVLAIRNGLRGTT